MKAVVASAINPENPLDVLAIQEMPEPETQPYWSTIEVKAASLNHHDLWSLQGVGLSEKQTPMILGTDAAGILTHDINPRLGLVEGAEVVIYGVNGLDYAGVAPGEKRTLFSEYYPGTMAQYVAVPSAHVRLKPRHLTFAQASVLGTSWLTAYSMLFSASQVKPGDTVLIQGASGGVASAAIQLARAAGLEVWATSRTGETRSRALEIGAHQTFEPGARLPHKVDAVIESVGQATWKHSVSCVRPGRVIAVCGATTGDMPGAELTRVFFQNIRVQGVTMGSLEDFERLLRFVSVTGLEPVIDSVYPFEQAPQAFRKLYEGDFFGKIVLEMK